MSRIVVSARGRGGTVRIRHERIAPSRDFAERQDVVVGAPFLRNRIVAPVVEVEYDWTWLWRASGKMHKPVDVRTSLVPAEPDAAAPLVQQTDRVDDLVRLSVRIADEEKGRFFIGFSQVRTELIVLLRAVVDDLIDLYGPVIRAGLQTFHAVVAYLVGIQITHVAFAAVVTNLVLIENTILRHR